MAVYRVDCHADDPELVFRWIKANVLEAEVVRTIAYKIDTGWYMKNVFKRREDAEAFHRQWYPDETDHSVPPCGQFRREP